MWRDPHWVSQTGTPGGPPEYRRQYTDGYGFPVEGYGERGGGTTGHQGGPSIFLGCASGACHQAWGRAWAHEPPLIWYNSADHSVQVASWHG